MVVQQNGKVVRVYSHWYDELTSLTDGDVVLDPITGQFGQHASRTVERLLVSREERRLFGQIPGRMQ